MNESNKQGLISVAPHIGGRFDQNKAKEFAHRSTSEATRRAYTRVVLEFFRALGNLPLDAIEPAHVRAWRDALQRRPQKASTISFKLSVVRAFFGDLIALGLIDKNPADTKFVLPPVLPEDMAGRALTSEEVCKVLAGPDRRKPEGARDYALLLGMLRLGIHVSEIYSLKASDLRWSHGHWILKFKVKGGRERTLPVPDEMRTAIKEYLKLDDQHRRNLHSDGEDAYLFPQLPHAGNLPSRSRPEWSGTWWLDGVITVWLGKLSPHDLRRTSITRALDQGLSYRQVQMMSGHKDPKTVMRYDHHHENLDQNAINHLNYK